MRIVTMLEDIDLDDLRGLGGVHRLTGRALMTKWMVDGLVVDSRVEEFALYRDGDASPPLTALPTKEFAEWAGKGESVWFEPARHYWWKAAVVRQCLGVDVPIVTMMHSIGYSRQVLPLIACLAVGQGNNDVVVAGSKVSADAFREQCGSLAEALNLRENDVRVEVVPYGIPQVAAVSRSIARQVLGWDSVPRMLFIGRLTEDDKVDLYAFLEGASRLLSQKCEFRLVLAGACTPVQEALVRHKVDAFDLRGVVDVRPNITECEKHLLLSGADVFVSPSNTVAENFGLTVVEAMMHGLAVVCSDWGGYRELVRDGVDGFRVNTWWCSSRADAMELPFAVGNVETLSSIVAIDVGHLTMCLKRLVEDAALRTSFGRAGKTRAEAEFSIQRTVRRIANVLEACAAAPRQEGKAVELGVVRALGRYANSIVCDGGLVLADGMANPSRAVRAAALRQARSFLMWESMLASGSLSLDAESFELVRRGLGKVMSDV